MWRSPKFDPLHDGNSRAKWTRGFSLIKYIYARIAAPDANKALDFGDSCSGDSGRCYVMYLLVYF
jgi:hypothetical protein